MNFEEYISSPMFYNRIKVKVEMRLKESLISNPALKYFHPIHQGILII